MAGFNADKLGEQLDALNREQLAAIEKLSEELLTEMQRKGPLRAGEDGRESPAQVGTEKRRAKR